MVITNFQADVVVVGGGVAGVMAAVAAGRTGVRVLLVERCGFLGGNATGGLVGPFSTTYFNDEKVIAGLTDEVIERLDELGATLGTQKCPYPPGTTFGTGGWITTFDAEKLKFVLDDMVAGAGVQVLYNTQMHHVNLSEKNTINDVLVHSKAGTHSISGKIFIDATGDGDLAALSGAKFNVGSEDGEIQPATLIVDVSNVDLNKIKQYMVVHPEEFAWSTFPEYDKNPTRPCVAGSGFLSLIRNAKQNGELQLGRSRITFFSGVNEGQLKLNATRVNTRKIDDLETLSASEVEGRNQVRSLVNFIKKYIPGCENAEICAMGDYIGVRESRRVIGEYILNREDVLSGARFPDAIGCGAYPIDKHKPDDYGDDVILDDVWIELEDAYDIPYRCLLPLGIDNLLVAGRPISTTHDAMGSTRLMVHCMVTGQAAGAAAALSIRSRKNPRNISIESLQTELINQNAFIRKN